MNNSGTKVALIVVGVVAVLCCVGLVVTGVLGAFLMQANRVVMNPGGSTLEVRQATEPVRTQRSPFLDTPTSPAAEQTPSPEGTPVQAPAGSAAGEETLRILGEAEVPAADPIELAARLRGINSIPATASAPPGPYAVGDQKPFWVTNTDTNQNFQVEASLQYIGDHIYFWVEQGISFRQRDLEDLANTFDQEIYPLNREFFGSEWSPGIDNDPRIFILYVSNVGGVLGYFSSGDEVPPQARPDSNGHEMFIISADYLDLNTSTARSVLAHEFQHMIHFNQDRNEESWMNEGFSDLAAFLNGYDVGSHDQAYAIQPDLQLNDWPNDPNDPNATIPHYGAAFLYLAYFLDRFGEDMTRALVSDPGNGMFAVDDVLVEAGAVDPATGQPVLADDVFVDWTAANFLQDPDIADGRYTYNNYPNGPQTFETETFRNCSMGPEDRSVAQYGVDYVQFDCRGSYTLRFQGTGNTQVIPENPHSGDYAFWSNKGDESDMTLTRAFDFSGVSGPLTLQFWTWYDLETDYDYLYLEARLEGGEWQILNTPSGTDENPSGNSYGRGYNGVTGGWILEEVDLSTYAGQQVELRFEYVTDTAVNGEGFLLDDVAVPQIGYHTDFEQDEGGWEAAGFVRIQNILPQSYRLTLISRGAETTVQPIEIRPDQTAEITLDFQQGVADYILVVSGTARYTRQPAWYRLTGE